MVPVPELDDFELFNEGLAETCRQDLQRQLRGKGGAKAELSEEDRRAMLPLPVRPFEARRVELGQGNSLSLVRFDRNDYSVPTRYAYHAVVAIGRIEKVRLVVNDRLVGEHVRDWDKENVHNDPVHYLALLDTADFPEPRKVVQKPDLQRVPA